MRLQRSQRPRARFSTSRRFFCHAYVDLILFVSCVGQGWADGQPATGQTVFAFGRMCLGLRRRGPAAKRWTVRARRRLLDGSARTGALPPAAGFEAQP